jgi:hypothetical protein
MCQRVGLFARKRKPALFRTRQRRFAVRVTHLMALPSRHLFSRALQALFRLNHLPVREAIVAAKVLAEFNQIGRPAHCAHHRVKLVQPVAVPVRKLGHVALREGRLLVRDGVQGDRRIGDDPFAVAARDLAVQFGAVGFESFALNAPNLDTFGGCTDLALRLQGDALCFEAAMVDPRVDVELGQALIGELGPAFAPTPNHLGTIPVSHLLVKAVLIHRAHGQHDMGMGFCHAVLAHIPMHVEIGDHAQTYELRPREVAGEFNALRLRQFARNGEFHFAGKLGVLADFERLDIVPEPFAVAPYLRRVLRKHHLGMDDAALSGKVVAAIKALVAQPRTRTVGGRRHRAGAGLTANDLDVKMIDRHRDQISGTAERTSERRISAPSLEKFAGGTTASQAVLTTLQHCAGRPAIISHQH